MTSESAANLTSRAVFPTTTSRAFVCGFGMDGQLNQDFIAGIALATGSLGNPTSTNETLTNVFDRKTIALDRGFITYNPVAHNWLSLTGGKFPYPWQRTSVTFDPDLNPEGFDEKASFDFSGPLQNVNIQGIELLYNQANGKPGIPSQDSYALGMQISGRFVFGPWTATPSFLSLKWNRPDAILQESAFATAATTTGYQPPTPTGGPTPSPITGIPIPGEGQGCAKGSSFPSYPALRLRSQWHDQRHLRGFQRGAPLLLRIQLRGFHPPQPDPDRLHAFAGQHACWSSWTTSMPKLIL